MHATSTLTSAARILAATRIGVQRHRRPYSIKSRDKLAIMVASAGRANRNDSSELVMRCITQRIAFYRQSLGAIKFCDDGKTVQSFAFNACPELGEWVQG